MRVTSFDPTDPAGWEAVVRRCGGNALHLPAIYLADHDPGSVHCLGFEEDGEIHGCAVALLIEPGRLGRLRGRRRTLQLPTAPAVATEGAAGAVRAALFDHARGLGVANLVVQPGYGRWFTGDADLAPFRTGAITEFVLDPGRGYDELLAGMHKVHRKNIRRAQRSELELFEDASLEGLFRLREMQLASSARADEKTEGFSVRDEEAFRRMHEHVYATGIGTVLFAQLDGAAVAALAWIRAADRVLTVRSGSLPLGYQSRAMYLLHDELIRRCVEGSVEELNIGGVPSDANEPTHPQAGLYEFKNGFGGRPEERFALDVPLGEMGG